MILTLTVPAFAADGDDSSSSVLRIPEGTKVVTSDTVDDGIIERLQVKTIYIPSSVTTVKEGALTKYANVTTVYVDNSKENINIENGAFATGAAIVYSEKATTTTTKPKTTSTTKITTTTEKDSEDEDTTKSTTKTTTKKDDKTTKKTTLKTTVSSKATTSDPKNRTTVQHRTLTIKSTKKTTESAAGLIPEVEVDPEDIEEQPDPNMEPDTTTVTFAGEAITDKDGTIIGFEDPETGRSSGDGQGSGARVATIAAVAAVGLSAVAFLFLKLRRRP